ncbi:MAG: L,D-transpeptidase family protein, partial [Chromatiaceae bacterium]
KGYELLTLQGQPVDPSTVDWQNLEGFPYMVRQPPGPNNALGLVKFMFPNPHLVFLHDTNARHLFDRPRRLFSSGCIRVKEPFDLAERLLRDKDGWDRARIDEVVASGKTTRVRLDEPMPIIIGYATAVARDGQVVFREDIYDRDQGVLDALNAEFRIRNQDSS